MLVSIRDTGPGIAPEHQEKIFEPFTQAAAYINRKFGGTGLGLSLARNLAHALGGELALECSTIGDGTTFALTIDPGDLCGVHLMDQHAVDSYKPRVETLATISGLNQLVGKSILLVEDFKDNQLMIKALLTRHGATVAIASNGEEGVNLAQSGDYDLVLMDIQMPVLNGYLAVSKLRQAGYSRPVVALTAEAMKGELERCRAAGFNDYLAKPINRIDLISVAERYSNARTPNTEPAKVDLESPLESALANDDILGDLVEGFSKGLLGRPTEFRALVKNADWSAVRGLAHQLSGSGGGYGFPDVTTVARDLEREVKEAAPNQKRVKGLIDELERLANRIHSGLLKNVALPRSHSNEPLH